MTVTDNTNMKGYFERTTSAAPLAFFRVAFGLLILGSVIRFWTKGWIHDLYIAPKHFFSFYGFEFVEPLGVYTYVLFIICGLSALFVALGLYYRVASIGLFLSFTYIELMDKSTYLNHYYFVSMIGFLMMFLPAHVYFSVDSAKGRQVPARVINQWQLDSLKLFVALVYFFAGLAKVNSEWLWEAQPLKIWLPAKNDLPLIGWLFNYTWVAYMLSWAGCLYDLCIAFLLFNRSTRSWAFCLVVGFHLLTAILFPIGMFPYIMIMSALIFFSSDFHEKVIGFIRRIFKQQNQKQVFSPAVVESSIRHRLVLMVFALFFVIQLVTPLRYLLYPGNLFWNEEGYRFSWRVMLMEKAGHAQFIVRDATGREAIVENSEFLTKLQEKMMATQPDMILQYAHIIREHYKTKGFLGPKVYVDSYVTLNGRLGRPMIDPKTDLASTNDSFNHKSWILP
jgi:hypothetical protein